MPWKAVGLVGPGVRLSAIGARDYLTIFPVLTLHDVAAAVGTLRRVGSVMHINLARTARAGTAPIGGPLISTFDRIGISAHIISAVGNNSTGVVRGISLTVFADKERNGRALPHCAGAGIITDAHLAAYCRILTESLTTIGSTFINVGVTIAVIDPPIGAFTAIIPLPAGLGGARTHWVGRS